MSNANSLSLGKARTQTPAPTGIGAWAEKLRMAAFEGIKESDVTEIVAAQVQKAKEGDPKAIKFVMEMIGSTAAIAASPPPPIHVTVNGVRGKTKPRQARPTMVESSDKGPNMGQLKKLAAYFLLGNGGASTSAIASHLGIDHGETQIVLECDWFTLVNGRWALTPVGRREVG